MFFTRYIVVAVFNKFRGPGPREQIVCADTRVGVRDFKTYARMSAAHAHMYIVAESQCCCGSVNISVFLVGVVVIFLPNMCQILHQRWKK